MKRYKETILAAIKGIHQKKKRGDAMSIYNKVKPANVLEDRVNPSLHKLAKEEEEEERRSYRFISDKQKLTTKS